MKTKILLKSLLVLIVSIFCSVNVMGQWVPADLDWDTPFQPMNVVVSSATLDGASLETGDQIGVYDGANLVGYETVTDAFPATPLTIVVSMDEPGDPVDGAIVGNEMTFQVFDDGSNNFYSNLDVTYVSGTNEFEALGTTIVTMEGLTYDGQTFAFIPGWNLVSFQVTPDDLAVELCFADAIESGMVSKIKGHDEIYEFISGNDWMTSFDIDVTQGYWIYANQSGNFEIRGTYITSLPDIDLEKGWNLFPYYLSTTEDAEEFLESVDNGFNFADGTILEKKDGTQIKKVGGDWTDTFDLVPGNSYMIYVPADKDNLSY
jgi:hypothetical protein